jgi:hypothetical protein
VLVEFVIQPGIEDLQIRCAPTHPPGGDPDERIIVMFASASETFAALRLGPGHEPRLAGVVTGDA